MDLSKSPTKLPILKLYIVSLNVLIASTLQQVKANYIRVYQIRAAIYFTYNVITRFMIPRYR